MNKGSIIFIVTVCLTIGVCIWVNLPEFFFISGKSYVMKSMQQSEVQTEIRANITSYFGGSMRDFSLEELFQWENHYLSWADEMPVNRPTDPIEILEMGSSNLIQVHCLK